MLAVRRADQAWQASPLSSSTASTGLSALPARPGGATTPGCDSRLQLKRLGSGRHLRAIAKLFVPHKLSVPHEHLPWRIAARPEL